jgi:hypothetical protein
MFLKIFYEALISKNALKTFQLLSLMQNWGVSPSFYRTNVANQFFRPKPIDLIAQT